MRILDAFGVEIVDYYLNNDFTKKKHSVNFIVVHYTAGVSSAEARNSVLSWNGDSGQASANYVVDRNKIVHTVADDEAVYTWHCGTSGKYYHPTCRNSNSIGIEMQSDYDGKFPGYKNMKYPTDWDKYYLMDEVVENTAKLVAYLMKKYHLSDVDTQVLRHYDVTHKECPYPMVGKNEAKWVEFKQKVKKYLNGEVESMTKDITLMKGNEAIAHAAIRYGVDGYFGYPITPQSEILETLMAQMPWQTTGMVVLQAESELAAINMVYGGAATGKKVMTSSSSPGVSLKQEGISYLAGAELPCLIINVMRGGPGLGTIQPSQADYFQTVKGGGHGDYRLIALAPASVQEMADFVGLGFDLAFKYQNPAIILADGIVGQMMEKVTLPPFQPRRSEEEIIAQCPWAARGRQANRQPNVVTSLELDPAKMEENNLRFQAKYRQIEENEVRYEEFLCADAEYLLIAFGSSARICQKAVENAREEGIKVGLLRPITLWPFPTKILSAYAYQVKGMLSVELNAGQMIEDVRLAVNGKVKVEHFGRLGGIVFTPDEVLTALKDKLIHA